MTRTWAVDVPNHFDEIIEIKGWVQRLRQLGKVTFIILRDRSGIVQAIYEGDLPIKVHIEAVIRLRGKVAHEPKAPQGVELRLGVDGIEIMTDLEETPPFEVGLAKLNAGLEIILKHRAYSLRNEKLHAVFLIQAEIIEGFRAFLRSQHFLEITTPKLVASGTEGGSELFAVQYFEQPAFLAQSPQLYKQMMVGAGYERVFEVGKAYRAEEHNTARHINEYVSLDFEMGFIESHEDLMILENELLKSLMSHLSKKCVEPMERLGAKFPEVAKIPIVTLAEVHQILKEKYHKASPPGNLDPEGERLIAGWAEQEYKSEWLFITKYPVLKRPFYAMPDPHNENLTQSFDLLFRGLEVTTGGQRIHSYQQLVQKMKCFRLDSEKFDFYLDIFKYGMPPHGGLAIGLERLTMQLCGLGNIREASLFPRDRTRLTP